MDANELEAMFFEHVPEQFCRRALRMIFDARRRAAVRQNFHQLRPRTFGLGM